MSLRCKIGIHKYREKHANGMTSYFECERCEKRVYRQELGVNRPVDTEWISGADREPADTCYKPPGGGCYVCSVSEEDPRDDK